MALRVAKYYSEYVSEAKLAEQEGDLETAIEAYEQAVRQEPLDELPYNRLLVLYRKSKDYKKELRIVNRALKVFTGFYDKRKGKAFGRNAKALQTGKALLKALEGKKKDESYYPEPISKWMKRKEVIEKRLQKDV